MSKWIPLLVREQDYLELAALVASREAGRNAESTGWPADSQPVDLTASSTREGKLLATLKPWSVVSLRQLADSAETYATAMRWSKAMDVMLNHVGEFISSAQLAHEAGMTINQWRDAPRKLPSHLEKHYEPQLGWPLKAVGGRELRKDDQVYWGITKEQAARWSQVRGSVQPDGRSSAGQN